MSPAGAELRPGRVLGVCRCGRREGATARQRGGSGAARDCLGDALIQSLLRENFPLLALADPVIAACWCRWRASVTSPKVTTMVSAVSVQPARLVRGGWREPLARSSSLRSTASIRRDSFPLAAKSGRKAQPVQVATGLGGARLAPGRNLAQAAPVWGATHCSHCAITTGGCALPTVRRMRSRSGLASDAAVGGAARAKTGWGRAVQPDAAAGLARRTRPALG